MTDKDRRHTDSLVLSAMRQAATKLLAKKIGDEHVAQRRTSTMNEDELGAMIERLQDEVSE